jgi:hypothetical protein
VGSRRLFKLALALACAGFAYLVPLRELQAQNCSTLTGPGMSGRVSCPPTRHFNIPSSGGGSGTDLGAALGALGGLLDAVQSFSSGTSGGSSGASCRAGEGLCPGGGCAPLGSVCCSGNRHCPSGTVCTRGSECLPRNSPRVCSNGSYCDADHICMPGNHCLSRYSERVCSNGRYCDVGFMCTNDQKCLSVSDPRYCGNGRYCAQGSVCTSDKNCQSALASLDDLGSAQEAASRQAAEARRQAAEAEYQRQEGIRRQAAEEAHERARREAEAIRQREQSTQQAAEADHQRRRDDAERAKLQEQQRVKEAEDLHERKRGEEAAKKQAEEERKLASRQAAPKNSTGSSSAPSSSGSPQNAGRLRDVWRPQSGYVSAHVPSISCRTESTITGLPKDAKSSGQTNTSTMSQDTEKCLKLAGWTPAERYNHSRTVTLVFQPWLGAAIDLGFNQGLYYDQSVEKLKPLDWGSAKHDGVGIGPSDKDDPYKNPNDPNKDKVCGYSWVASGFAEAICAVRREERERKYSEDKYERDHVITDDQCVKRAGKIIDPNKDAISETRCRNEGGHVLSPYRGGDGEVIKAAGWLPDTQGCYLNKGDKEPWRKIVDERLPARLCKIVKERETLYYEVRRPGEAPQGNPNADALSSPSGDPFSGRLTR